LTDKTPIDTTMCVDTRGDLDDIAYPPSIGFSADSPRCVAAFWTGVTWRAVALAMALYVLRIIAIGAGCHRYFAHRAFSTSRICQFALAFFAQTSAQRGILWWASKHRRHHRYSDAADDVHSPVQAGFSLRSLGWIFVPRNDATDYTAVRDLARCKELMWLDRHQRRAQAGTACHRQGSGPARGVIPDQSDCARSA
jgi:stearoyl-CoA desaturase (delta-9 desaturase)